MTLQRGRFCLNHCGILRNPKCYQKFINWTQTSLNLKNIKFCLETWAHILGFVDAYSKFLEIFKSVHFRQNQLFILYYCIYLWKRLTMRLIYIIMTLVGYVHSVALKSWFCVKWTLLTISRNLELASTKPEIWAQVFKQPISLPIEIQIHYSATMTKVLLLWLDTHIYPQWSQSLSEILFELFFCDFAISECNLYTIL